MPRSYLILIPLALLPVMFLLNPGLEQHESSYRELFLDTVAQASLKGEDSKPAFDGLDHALTTRMKMTNYHLFSLSYVKSAQTEKLHIIGLGLFEKVFRLSSPKELRFYFYRNKRLTDELQNYGLRKGEESPFGWRTIVNPKALRWLGIK